MGITKANLKRRNAKKKRELGVCNHSDITSGLTVSEYKSHARLLRLLLKQLSHRGYFDVINCSCTIRTKGELLSGQRDGH
jgi:hypothetical protein